MSTFLLCYLAVLWVPTSDGGHVDYMRPQCDVMQADKLDDDTLDVMIDELTARYDIDEMPLTSISVRSKGRWLLIAEY